MKRTFKMVLIISSCLRLMLLASPAVADEACCEAIDSYEGEPDFSSYVHVYKVCDFNPGSLDYSLQKLNCALHEGIRHGGAKAKYVEPSVVKKPVYRLHSKENGSKNKTAFLGHLITLCEPENSGGSVVSSDCCGTIEYYESFADNYLRLRAAEVVFDVCDFEPGTCEYESAVVECQELETEYPGMIRNIPRDHF